MLRPPVRNPDSRPSRWLESAVVAVLLAAGVVVRVLALLHHDVNSDEPQHLHVAWGWTQGLLPYRDVFDNHSPLFSLLLSPLLAFLGERADIVILMRAAMLPMIAAALVATWFLARRLFDARVAWWAVALASLNPEFLRGSVEYRTDQLWTAVWLVALAVLLGDPLTRARAWWGGVVIGIALATSMKTTLLLSAFAIAGAMGVAAFAGGSRGRPWRALAVRAAFAACGAAVVPAAFAAWFASRGAWGDLLYGVIWHNVMPGLGLWGTAPQRPLGVLLALPLLAWLGVRVQRGAATPALGVRRAWLLLGTLFTHAAIEGFWPLVTRADLLPLVPVEAVFAAAGLLALPGVLAKRAGAGVAVRVLRWAPAALAVAQLVVAATAEPVWIDHTRQEVSLLRLVLAYTRPGELVMDTKGEAIFRPRPLHIALETITEEKLRRGLLPDDVVARLVASRTGAAIQYYRAPLPPRACAFIDANYLPLGALRVAGQRLAPVAGGADVRAFRIEIPQRYAIVTASGTAAGTLDGTPVKGPRDLARGSHVYRAAPGEGEVVVAWAPAVERGARLFPPGPSRDLARGRAPARPGATLVTDVTMPEPDHASAADAARDSVVRFSAADRVLVLAPHPDDESVATGGLIVAARAAGAEVRVVYATDGDRNPWAQVAFEGRWPVSAADRAHWGRLRRGEARNALAVLGVDRARTEWLGLPDQGLTDQMLGGDTRLRDAIAREIGVFRPTLVVAPATFDRHPDHSAMGVALAFALARASAGAAAPRVIAYRVHAGDHDPDPALYVPLSAAEQARKRRAILCHLSQLRWHHASLPAHARPREGYEPVALPPDPREPHVVRFARIDDGTLHVEFARGRRIGLGAVRVRVAFADAGGGMECLTLRLPASGGGVHLATDAVREGGRSTLEHAATSAVLERRGERWLLSLPLGSRPAVCFVKLERPRERELGLFDDNGWWPVAEPRTAPSSRAAATLYSYEP